MGLSASIGYAEENLVVELVDDEPQAHETEDEIIRRKRAAQKAQDWAKFVNDGFGLDMEEMDMLIYGKPRQREVEIDPVTLRQMKIDAWKKIARSRNDFKESDPQVFELLEEIGVRPSLNRSPLDLVLELLPFTGPLYENYYPRVDHFVMRILWHERDSWDEWQGFIGESGKTLLHMAAESLSMELVPFLMDEVEVNPHLLCNDGRSALHLCTLFADGDSKELIGDHAFKICERLLRAKVSPTIQDKQGCTPLHYASGNGDQVTVALLLLYGAEPSTQDIQGLRPVDYALNYERNEVVTLLHTNSHWEEFQDKRSGRLFYWNKLTQEKTMERPLNVATSLATVVRQAQANNQNINGEDDGEEQRTLNNCVSYGDIPSPPLELKEMYYNDDENGDGDTDYSDEADSTFDEEGKDDDRDGLISEASVRRSSMGSSGSRGSERLLGSTSSNASSHRRGSEKLKRMGSSRSSVQSRRGSLTRRSSTNKNWKEVAWAEGIKKASEKRNVHSLQALRDYQKEAALEPHMNNEKVDELKEELNAMIKNQKITLEEVKALQQNLQNEKDERNKVLKQLEDAQTRIAEAERERELATQHAAEAGELNVKLQDMEKTLLMQAEENENLRKKYEREKQLRKTAHNRNMDLLGAIRVYCRIRPLSESERQYHTEQNIEGEACYAELGLNGDMIVIPSKDNKSYTFDSVLGPESCQRDVFEQVEPLIQSALDGYNVCIFAYGQTGSGKSFTMFGPNDEENPHLHGIAPRTVRSIFEMLEESSKLNFCVKCYGVELYNNKLIDLLQKDKSGGPDLVVKKDRSGTVVIENVTIEQVAGPNELNALMRKMQDRRKVSSTQMNSESSRSHFIFSVLIETTDPVTKETLIGKLSLVDLAGSEKVAKSGVQGQGLKEAVAINQSLSALGDVINALTEQKKFVPYRNHVLTQLMQDGLGGNAKTLMFVNVSPLISSVPETVNSLQYASRVKRIKNVTSKHVETEEVRELKRQIKELQELKNMANV